MPKQEIQVVERESKFSKIARQGRAWVVATAATAVGIMSPVLAQTGGDYGDLTTKANGFAETGKTTAFAILGVGIVLVGGYFLMKHIKRGAGKA